jgi:hypothetical protein
MTSRKEAFTVLGVVAEDNGKKRIQIHSPGHYQTQVSKLPVGRKVSITVSEDKSSRSSSQLKYFMVLAGYIADHTGYTRDEMYPLLIEDVFPPKDILFRGEVRKVRRSVSDYANMPTADMAELIQHAKDVCDELGVNVPTAESLGYISNYASVQ